MYKTISNKIIREFKPCYDPSEVIKDENEELPIKDWVNKYRKVIPARNIIWLLLRKEFLSEKDLRLFAVWCAREALKLIENPDKRSVEACNVAERYANGQATNEELLAASDAALNVTHDVSRYVSHSAADAAYNAVYIDLDTSNAARAADYAAYHAERAAHHASNMAYVAALIDSDAVYRADGDDDTDDADVAYAAIRYAQIDQLLTYFE
jgi:hypothetical protein